MSPDPAARIRTDAAMPVPAFLAPGSARPQASAGKTEFLGVISLAVGPPLRPGDLRHVAGWPVPIGRALVRQLERSSACATAQATGCAVLSVRDSDALLAHWRSAAT